MKTGLAKFQPPPLPKEATDTDKRNYAIPQYTVLPYTDTHPYDMQAVESPAASTSAWVSSMAMAADKPRTPWYPPRPHLMFPPAIDTASISYPMPHSLTPTAHSKKSQPPQIIGMKPDPDPYSKHGTFHISSATTQSRPSGDSQKDAYIPNPARTLVMEKLPKQHRTADFAKSWSKSACGAYPVYFAVDYPSGKALVEFATAELARKAWGSPKLGNAFAGLKPHQLKGKPREDLIRVWWYRVDGIGAEAGVGEIEEGEIEGDAGETEVSVPAKKETKKERKARLAQERLAKMKTKDPQTVQKGGKTTQQQQQPSKIDSQPQNGFHNVSKQIEPVAHKPPPFDYIYYPPYPVHPPFPPSTLPQAELAKPKQRRERFAQYKQPDRSYYGSSINEEGSGTHNDHESIASSRAHSIVSERPSPTHDPHNGNEITPMSISDNGDSDNMEIEMDDMEVESPDSYTTMFNLPTAVVDSAHDPSSAPLPSRPTLPVNSPVPKIGQPPPAISTRGVLDAHLIQPLSVPPTLPTPTPTPPSSFVPAAASHNSSTQATTPSTSSSPAPYQAPSEPRAMKNAPKGPSYAKRSLMARQKELEEMIAKSKVQLGQATASKVLTSVQAPVPVALAAATPEPSDTQSTDAAEKLAMEARLRQLVLKSQKNRVKGPTTPAAPPIPPATPLGTDSSPAAIPISTMFSVPGSPARSPVLNSPEATPSLPVTVSNISFDDMAISFITETIQTLQPGSPTPVIPAPPTQAPISKYHTSQTHTQTKLDLAAKQKRLEQHITDSKILMAKLSQARTKQEKDAILAAMRECSRCVVFPTRSHRFCVGVMRRLKILTVCVFFWGVGFASF